MKKLLLIFSAALLTSCINTGKNVSGNDGAISLNAEEAKKDISLTLDNWHSAAAEANFENYFKAMTSDGVFIGTDAGENWGIEEFKKFSKPYFDRGTAWNFKTLERNIYTSQKAEITWFDELLETWMGICRGSGVMEKENGEWKIKHYVLSVTIPNENINEIVRINREIDSSLVHKLRNPK